MVSINSSNCPKQGVGHISSDSGSSSSSSGGTVSASSGGSSSSGGVFNNAASVSSDGSISFGGGHYNTKDDNGVQIIQAPSGTDSNNSPINFDNDPNHYNHKDSEGVQVIAAPSGTTSSNSPINFDSDPNHYNHKDAEGVQIIQASDTTSGSGTTSATSSEVHNPAGTTITESNGDVTKYGDSGKTVTNAAGDVARYDNSGKIIAGTGGATTTNSNGKVNNFAIDSTMPASTQALYTAYNDYHQKLDQFPNHGVLTNSTPTTVQAGVSPAPQTTASKPIMENNGKSIDENYKEFHDNLNKMNGNNNNNNGSWWDWLFPKSSGSTAPSTRTNNTTSGITANNTTTDNKTTGSGTPTINLGSNKVGPAGSFLNLYGKNNSVGLNNTSNSGSGKFQNPANGFWGLVFSPFRYLADHTGPIEKTY